MMMLMQCVVVAVSFSFLVLMEIMYCYKNDILDEGRKKIPSGIRYNALYPSYNEKICTD